MNFLAHIYLSGNSEKILVGNFMGDYVKGKDYMKYPPEIRKGILLHRDIDYYTDTHPVTRLSRNHIREKYGKYSGIVIDIFYDYFLAKTWENYCSSSLSEFVQHSFKILKDHYPIFPQRIRNWFPNFIRNNWLISYSSLHGIEMVLHRMSSRTSLPAHTEYAIEMLEENREAFFNEFNRFFPDIRNYIYEKYEIETGCISSGENSKKTA
jgi:acyl carrier protein phosphodiesterase